jgi:DNA-binding response OmpR family regulator
MESIFKSRNICLTMVSAKRVLSSCISDDGPSLIILDLRDGATQTSDFMHEVLTRFDVPVIITAGYHGSEADCIVGLEHGADDYITEPFGPHELVARVQAVLRRRKRATVPHASKRIRSRFGDWQLDQRSRRLSNRDGIEVPLTKGDYALLVAFVGAPQRPLTRGYLLQATRVHENASNRSIDVQVSRLRHKLESGTQASRIIRSIQGVGYIFTLPVEFY